MTSAHAYEPSPHTCAPAEAVDATEHGQVVQYLTRNGQQIAALASDPRPAGVKPLERLRWLMASRQTLERRIAALEARLADIEGGYGDTGYGDTGYGDTGYGDTLYKLHRASVKADLRTARILKRWEIEDVSDEDVDRMVFPPPWIRGDAAS